MPLTANAEVLRMPEGLVEYPVAANAKVFQGAMMSVASGYAKPLAAGEQFIGIAYEAADNTGGSAGARKVRVQIRGVFRLSGSGFAQADVGKAVYASADDTITLTSSGNSPVGEAVKFDSASALWVRIAP